MYKKILLATDGSKCSNIAAEHAIKIAEQNNAELIVLAVTETYSVEKLPVEDLTRKVIQLFKEESEKALEDVKDMIEEKGYPIKFTLKNVEGKAADSILQVAEDEDVDLIVVGVSGKHALERFVLGSVSEKVVRNARVPVLVVRSKR
ncbi:MAG TPA: universal stress protein [Methanothermobacter sp.]|uniref:Universal stress protein n=1 Tax=Methanothermobacter tenebrarum TaxID=680118 RepID=A0ABM7YCQ0_9EURY|nr:universal stress protein [Methanothermobacter tenebrarum]MDD3453965.1 universal stress protein [Methanobacteriales archaeon]MDI6881898.1 universal stress protein [Methanothermobacter sp.]MDX9692702.1 universal stress protein [Methanothermobacter sp.]BDH79101.1 universal stress protein [Methanothermobacter tenebrarum]HHW16824.1 universal stress protein [Methanothermobacter sp.]